MSNYKPRIETNNLDLTSILSTINELPDAGPNIEVSTVTIPATMEIPFGTVSCRVAVLIYTTPEMNSVKIGENSASVVTLPYTFYVPKGSIIYLYSSRIPETGESDYGTAMITGATVLHAVIASGSETGHNVVRIDSDTAMIAPIGRPPL